MRAITLWELFSKGPFCTITLKQQLHKEKNVSISLDIEKSLLEERQEKGNYYNNTPVIIVIIINIRDTKVFFN